jgi:hypothetical protein
MKNKIIIPLLLLLIIAIGLYFYRKDKTEATPINSGSITIYPESFPDKRVSGIDFPTDSTTIIGWTNDSTYANYYDSVSVYDHAWGIWAGLTAETRQKIKGDKRNLLIYETWMGINEVRDMIIANKPIVANQKGTFYRSRALLTAPKQFEHAGMSNKNLVAASKKGTAAGTLPKGFWVTVSYNPQAAQYASENKILRQSVLNNYYSKGQIGNIPVFPNDAITVKPTYLVYSSKSKLLQMPVWTSPPDPTGYVAPIAGQGAPLFPLCVYVDTENKQRKDKKLVPVSTSSTDPAAIRNATCNLNDFISFRIAKDMVGLMMEQDSIQGLNDSINPVSQGGEQSQVAAGDLAILVAMHVSTKEVSNWTWQTFYWTPTPENPGAPSSRLAYSRMSGKVKGAARHYAANAAYVMTTPYNSPSKNAGQMFGYNPYLEGGFGPSTFAAKNGQFPSLQFGMQSNCMSCHAMASDIPANLYNTDQAINLDSSVFVNLVRLDFAWSIQSSVINDATPYYQAPANQTTRKKKKN